MIPSPALDVRARESRRRRARPPVAKIRPEMSGTRDNWPSQSAQNLAACGFGPPRAYRPEWRRGRVAEGGGLLNRYRVVKPYRGFESLRLRHPQCKSLPKFRRNAESRLPLAARLLS